MLKYRNAQSIMGHVRPDESSVPLNHRVPEIRSHPSVWTKSFILFNRRLLPSRNEVLGFPDVT